MIEKLEGLVTRAKVIASTAVSWLIAASAVLTALSDQLAKVVPILPDGAAQVVIGVIGVLAAIVLVIRRVVTVVPQQRQILPLPAGTEIQPVPGTVADPNTAG